MLCFKKSNTALITVKHKKGVEVESGQKMAFVTRHIFCHKEIIYSTIYKVFLFL